MNSCTDVVLRAEIGRLLGRLGDGRRGVCLQNDEKTPDIWWLDVPGNADTAAFRMSKYPVTIAQFKAFVDAGAYDVQDFWTHGGWEYRTWWEIDIHAGQT